MKAKYLLVVNHVVSSVFKSVEEIKKLPEYADLQVIVITKDARLKEKYSAYISPSNVIECSFSDAEEIEKALSPYISNIVGVICRGDKHIQYLRKIVPLLPKGVQVSSADALKAATNKSLMRKQFAAKYPEITLKYLEIQDDSAATIDRIESTVGYPVIIKPANLFSSLLIQACANRQELQPALSNIFSAASSAYQAEDINEHPIILAEQYLDGELYSTDAFVLEAGDITCCPLVPYISAQNLRIDDFFLYKRYLPAELPGDEVKQAFETAKKAVMALGLKYSAAHIELIETKDGWKIIELGPRLGRFRNVMYKLSYGIDMSLNDLKTHLNIEPDIPAKTLQFCAAYSIYPKQEGKLKSINGIERVQQSPLTKSIRVLSQPGDNCLFAKHGGHALVEFIIAGANQPEYQEMVEYIEKNVSADID